MVLVACVALLAGSAFAQSLGDRRREPDVLRWNGPVNAKMVEVLRDAPASIRTLNITSLGGEFDAAIAVARLIRERELKVVVSGACLSVCAHYLFASAVAREVLPHTIVGFHNTPSSAFWMMQAVPAAAAKFESRMRLEDGLYESWKIDHTLLLRPQLAIRTSCYSVDLTDDSTIRSLQFKSPFSVWVPSKGFMARAGITFDGYWPIVPGQAAAEFEAVKREAPRIGPSVFGESDGPEEAEQSYDALKRQLSRISGCAR